MLPKLWKVTGYVFIVFAFSTIAALGGGGWYYSGELNKGALKVDHSEDPFDLKVTAFSEDQVTLRITPPHTNEESDWREKGVWGLARESGYDQVGAILQMTNQEIIREYFPLTGDLTVGDTVRIDSFAFPENPQKAHGIPFSEISYSSPLGEFPAWFIDGSSDTWVIFVHGRDSSRRESLRMLSAVAETGLPSLIITYRNDPEVPVNPDGFHRFGQTEWVDLEGAVAYALNMGADDLVIVGYSMGGAIVLSFLYQSTLAERVVGVVLDSPVLDFDAAVDHGASQRSIPFLGLPLPGSLTWVAKVLSGLRFDLNFEALDYLNRVDELSVPILLFHGDADDKVPVESSDALAEARPDIVRYVRSEGVNHVHSWNANHTVYETTVKNFLQEVIQ